MPGKLIWHPQTAKSGLFRFFRKVEVDRAVFYGISARVWGLVAGPVTVLLIATRFSSELQGYYYTFANLLALQIFVELGLGTVIVQFASHEWSRLRLDRDGKIAGDAESLSRLSSLAILALKWFLVGAVIVGLGLSIGGYAFFSRSTTPGVNWVFPWFLLCTLTGVSIVLVPVWSLLEGCNQVSGVYLFRLVEGVVSAISVWIAISLGAELWTTSISTAVVILCAGLFLCTRYREFFKSLYPSRAGGGAAFHWRRDILPMQWRIALSWVSGYFVFSLFTPALFHFHGPVVAGRFGMTWSLVGFIGSIATAWIAPRVPQFGLFIASRNYRELDELFLRVTKIAMLVTVSLASTFWVFVWLLNRFEFPLANRLLPPFPAGVLIAAQVVMTLSIPFSMYLRAHKKEPLLALSVISGIATGTSTVFLGKHYSAIGVSCGYLAVNLVLVPCLLLVWQRCRKEWH